MSDPVLLVNQNGSYREGLTRDIRFNDRSGFATRHGHVGKVGSGRSYQGKLALILDTKRTEAYGKHQLQRNPMLSNAEDRLRISKKKLTRGPGIGLTRREYLRRIFIGVRDRNVNGRLHNDTPGATEDFNRQLVKSSSSKYNVNVRPLMSYKEVNNDDKKCKYGKFRDGGRWRCAQNLNHKRGGADGEVGDRDSDGDGRDGRRLTADEHEAAYPHLYHQDDEDEEDSVVPNERHRARRAADMDDEEEEEGGGGGDFGDHAYEEKEDDEGRVVHPDEDTEDESAYARRIKRAKKERVRRKQAGVLKQLADYNKNPPRKSSRKK
jgi:hypothetical protein